MIPPTLTKYAQWVNWKKDGAKKVPIDPKTQGPASVTDPSTWGKYQDLRGRNVGFVFTKNDPFVGIDIDNCFKDRKLVPGALKIVKLLNSYTELSPSGNGLHIIIHATLPKNCKHRIKLDNFEIELYDNARFFTMTGKTVPIKRDIEFRQPELESMLSMIGRAFGPEDHTGGVSEVNTGGVSEVKKKRLEKSEKELLCLIGRSRHAQKFERLMAGDTSLYGGDESRADMALLRILWTFSENRELVEKVARTSGLRRKKWDEKRGIRTYFDLTLDKIAST